MRRSIVALLLATGVPIAFSSSVAADTVTMATPGGSFVVGSANLPSAPVPAYQTLDAPPDVPFVAAADPVGPPGNFKRTFWGYEASFGNAQVLQYLLGPTGQAPVTFQSSCVPTLNDGGGVTGNGRGLAYDPLDANLWITRLTGFAGDGKIHKIVPPNVDPTCPEVQTLVVHSQDGRPVQDDFGALDVDQGSKHIWAAGYKPVSSGGLLKSYVYLINRNNGLILQSCWLPFRDGGLGNDSLTYMRLPQGVLPGSGQYLLTDAGELITTLNTVAVIDSADCHGGNQVTPVAELPKTHALTGIDYEWNGSTSADNIEGGLMQFYNDGGPVPFVNGSSTIGLTAPSVEMEDISICGYRATFGGGGNDMCPYP